MKSFKWSIIIFCLILGNYTSTAQVDFPSNFHELMEQMDVLVASPVERSYRRKRIKRSDIFSPSYVIRSRKKRIEIQYALQVQHNQFLVPQVHASTTLTSLASNHENHSSIAIHKIEEQELVEQFNADWGSIAYFQPKQSFSRFQYGKLLSLYKSGKGMVYVLFLFDRGGAEEAERQFYAAKFK